MLPTKNEETRITGPTSYQSTILGLQQGTITQLPERKESLTLERINSRKTPRSGSKQENTVSGIKLTLRFLNQKCPGLVESEKTASPPSRGRSNQEESCE